MLADLLLFSFEEEFVRNLLHEKKKSEAVTFNLTFLYIDDILLNYNDNFHSDVDSIYPIKLEIKDIIESPMSASYLYILLNSHSWQTN